MKISSSNNSNWISITGMEMETEYVPGVCVSIEINTILQVSFDATEQVWVEKWRIEKFIAELQDLDITRNSTAVLESTSPNKFLCSISNLDNLGHLYLKLKMSSDSESDEYYKLETGFEIDAGNISGIINGFQELIEEN